jgi:hypothetical protein
LTYKPQYGLLFPIALIAAGHWRVFVSASVTPIAMFVISWLAFGTESWLAFFHWLPRFSQAMLTEVKATWWKLGVASSVPAARAAAWRDGFRILGTILKLYRSEKRLRFFTVIRIFLILVSVVLATPIIITFFEEGVVPRLPIAVLSMGLMIVAVLSVSAGLALDTVTRGRARDEALGLFVAASD